MKGIMTPTARRIAATLLLLAASVAGTLLPAGQASTAHASDTTTVLLSRYLRSTPTVLYHWTTTDTSSPIAAGFTFEGPQAYLAPAGVPGTQPLYSCLIGNDHFNSLDPTCEGQTLVGIDGYVFSSPAAAPSGTQTYTLYRCFDGTTHLTTVSSTCENAAPYHLEGLLGWALTLPYDFAATGGTGGGGATIPTGSQLVTVGPTIQFQPCITNCGRGQYPLTPPAPVPVGVPNVFQVHNMPSPGASYETLIVGNAATNGGTSYAPDEATFIYTTLLACAVDQQQSLGTGLQVAPTFSLLGAPSASDLPTWYGTDDAHLQQGVVMWASPQCEHWYVDAPLAYDRVTYQFLFQDDATAYLSQADGDKIWSDELSYATVQSGGLCPGGCLVDEQQMELATIPYHLISTFNSAAGPSAAADAALSMASSEFTWLQNAFAFIHTGCPSGQTLVLNPNPQASSTFTPSFVGLNGNHAAISVTVQCITLPGSAECAPVLDRINSLQDGLEYLMNPAGFAQCAYNSDNGLEPAGIAEDFLGEGLEVLGADPPGAGFGISRNGVGPLYFSDARAASSVGVVTSSNNAAVSGDIVTYRVAVSGSASHDPSGTVTFTDNNATIVGCAALPVLNGMAYCSTPVGNAGTHLIVAGYAGDANLQPSSSPSALDAEVSLPAAPALALPNAITAEATGPAGATVSYSASAYDAFGGAPVSCSPASGATFALGTTSVTCAASNVGGASTGSFNVTVQDTTPPQVTVPANITTTATGVSGAAVTYSATASDLVDGALTPTCAPASGTVFGFGATTVTCSATDAHGNTGSASFTVTIQPFTFLGFFSPISMTQLNTAKGGSTVPVKWQLQGQGGALITDVATVANGWPKAQQLACGSLASLSQDPIATTATGGTSLRYDTTARQFIYNWKTPSQSNTCWRLDVKLVDGTTHSADFMLK